MENKKVKFNSFWDPIPVQPTDCSDPMVSQDELGYNEKGQVIVIEKPKKNIQDEINSYEADSVLSEQLKRIAETGKRAEGTTFLDVSNAPKDEIELNEMRKKLNAKEAEMRKNGYDPQAILKATDKELEEMVRRIVEEKTKETKKEDNQ